MTLKISVEEVQGLLLNLADYVGPAAFQFINILKDCDVLTESDWSILISEFSRFTDSDALEEACFLAMEKGINEMCHFAILLREVEKAEME